ncbi:hypothetical protein AAD018_017000 [Aestuariibius insulae]|uniref:hypothetical protein n=1 Tax=Aestuariibius insulae TaxID=2058287 RepID=UPI00345E9163
MSEEAIRIGMAGLCAAVFVLVGSDRLKNREGAPLGQPLYTAGLIGAILMVAIAQILSFLALRLMGEDPGPLAQTPGQAALAIFGAAVVVDVVLVALRERRRRQAE